ncbi:glycosyltransferase [Massilia sp. DWR3-1-1]|uniref:glycosyltransferase n=1 Tax=Massilia sp. DWR3-1-1 TaxID=2804559 RepID=UPI003CF8DE82
MAIGSAGDLFPMLRIALALRQRGHRISVLGPEQHRPYVLQAGLAFHGEPVDEAVLDDPRLWHPRHGFGVVWAATRGVAGALPRFVEALPVAEACVLLVHPLALPEADLCRAARPDIRVATVYLAPSNLPTVHDPLMVGPLAVPRWVPAAARRWLWRQVGERLIDPVVLPGVNRERRLRGLSPVRHALGYLLQVPDLSLALFPAWFAATQPDWPKPLLHADFPLYEPDPAASFTPALAAFLAAGEAPVVFTPGTGNRQGAAYFQCALQATLRLQRRAIFLTPHAQQVPASLPPGVLWQPYVPLARLLPECAAIVHHGGIGTTAEALRSGIAQLVVPFAHDQFDNAARVTALGAGQTLPATGLSASRLTRSLRRVLSSRALAVNCRALSSRFAPNPDIEQVCAALVNLPL